MAEKIELRKLTKNELELYHQIRLECLQNYPDNFGTLYEEEFETKNFKFDKIISTENSTDFLIGAFIENQLIGICGYIVEKRKKTKHIGEISGMYVKSEFSGRKVGKKLIIKVIETAFKNTELDQIILAVADRNENAKQLYNKVGFVEYGRLKSYFKTNQNYETQVFMTLTRENWIHKII
jgi:RimJ/RimL family protein N-acetyltransferase